MDLDAIRVRLSATLGEFRFRIEQVHLAGTTVLDELDNGFSSSRKVAPARFEVIVDRWVGSAQQVGKHETAETETGSLQNGPPAWHSPLVPWRAGRPHPPVASFLR